MGICYVGKCYVDNVNILEFFGFSIIDFVLIW